MSQVTQKDRTETRAEAEANQRVQQLRAEIAEINRDLSDEQQLALAERWAVAVRARLAARVRRLRNQQDA